MHSTHISRYERDLTQPTLEVIRKIADALKVSADELVYGPKDEQAKNNINDNELLNMFSRVQSFNKDDINCVKSFLGAFIFQKEIKNQLIQK